MKSARYELRITGIVQGVGFRPFVYGLAKDLGLKGCVKNVSGSVIVEIEGDGEMLEAFIKRLKSEAPPLSHIRDIHMEERPWKGYGDFTIEHSSSAGAQNIYISPDVCTCPDCRRELFSSEDRRFLYPFINCTNCGPRFTIVKGVPYDRVNTTMSVFPMCDKCAAEYNDRQDRRYHAQPVSCYQCGPSLALLDRAGHKIKADDLIGRTRDLILAGNIVAVKGMGGYHLVCNALDGNAVRELRRRKIRDDKPFALMVGDWEAACKYCHVRQEEKDLLESAQRPIVLLRKREDCGLPEEIAPGNPHLGIMLPYTPVHLLLFHTDPSAPMPFVFVMTSGNLSSEPIYYKDEEALENLKDISDYFLVNDREIFIRTDDSVTRIFREREYILRRARGYVPRPVTCEAVNSLEYVPTVLACGGELKSTFCLNKGDEFYLSHHIGDLENAETLASFEEGIEHFKRIFNIEYDAVAHDLHPEYLSTKYALALESKNRIAVQHHHAHIASCMAENGLEGDVIGIAFDGTGYGEDGNMWGGEFFTGGYEGFQRVGHLDYVRMPGGEMAVREPWRMAVSYLYKTDRSLVNAIQGLDEIKAAAIVQMLERNLNSPLTSSMGRLFDAVSALLGVRSMINYEGQAAVELEYIAGRQDAGSYEILFEEQNGIFKVCTEGIIKGIIGDMKRGKAKDVIASKFHETAANIVLAGCERIRRNIGLQRVALSGGVFQNMILLEKCFTKLESAGFGVYIHSKVPANDGGISLGQAVMAVFKAVNG